MFTSNSPTNGIDASCSTMSISISGSVGFAIQARASAGWVSGSYPSKLVFYSGEQGHENWPDQGVFRIDPDGKTNIGTDDDPQEMLWVSGSIQSYVEGSHISASRVIGESITGSSIQLVDSNTKLTQHDSNGQLKITTQHGYTRIGPNNSTYLLRGISSELDSFSIFSNTFLKPFS